ncbi:MAG TPA: hypothetical protein VKZ63_08780 [Kofleriaceae bacterium]|nr:hypothetical protein [Kofleriaceae bacterium]
MARRSLPRARVVSGAAAHDPVGSRVRSAARTMRPAVRGALEVTFGVWPIWVVAAATFGLVWFIAMSQSP